MVLEGWNVVDVDAYVGAASTVLCLAAAVFVRYVLSRAPVRVPQALAYLLTGACADWLLPHSKARAHATKAFVDVALCVVGFEIGAHLNREVLWALWRPVAKLLLVMIPVVFCTVAVVSSLLYPSLRRYAPLVAIIAVERSSAEAMAGINEANAVGQFASATMCAATLMDVSALVAYVLMSAVVGAQGVVAAGNALLGMAAATAVGPLSAILINRVPTTPQVVLALMLCALLGAHYVFHGELLLGAVIAGSTLNFSAPHSTALVLRRIMPAGQLVLFTLLGTRIQPSKYANEMTSAVILYASRIAGLWIGGALGSVAASQPHKNIRWMTLVTQLALALLLVFRMEENFPESAPLARAYGGAVLLALLTGPSALQYALVRAGEAQQQQGAPKDDPSMQKSKQDVDSNSTTAL